MPSPQYRPAKWCSRQPPRLPIWSFHSVQFQQNSKSPKYCDENLQRKQSEFRRETAHYHKALGASQNICPQGSTAKASPWFKSLGCSPLCFVLPTSIINIHELSIYLLHSCEKWIGLMNFRKISPSCSCRTWYEITTYGSFEIHSRHCWCLEGRALYTYASAFKGQLWHYGNQELESCRDLFSNWTTVLGERSWLIHIVDSGLTFRKAYM